MKSVWKVSRSLGTKDQSGRFMKTVFGADQIVPACTVEYSQVYDKKEARR